MFALLTVFLIQQFRAHGPEVEVMPYAHDLLMWIPGADDAA